MKTHDIPNQYSCPHCMALHECASNIKGHGAPQNDDFGVCFNCGELNVYVVDKNGAYSLRKPTNEDIEVAIQSGCINQILIAQSLIKTRHAKSN
jgi:hypothetical protein